MPDWTGVKIEGNEARDCPHCGSMQAVEMIDPQTRILACVQCDQMAVPYYGENPGLLKDSGYKLDRSKPHRPQCPACREHALIHEEKYYWFCGECDELFAWTDKRMFRDCGKKAHPFHHLVDETMNPVWLDENYDIVDEAPDDEYPDPENPL